MVEWDPDWCNSVPFGAEPRGGGQDILTAFSCENTIDNYPEGLLEDNLGDTTADIGISPFVAPSALYIVPPVPQAFEEPVVNSQSIVSTPAPAEIEHQGGGGLQLDERRRGGGVLGLLRVKHNSKNGPGRKKQQRSCLPCRSNKKKCTHSTSVNPTVLEAELGNFSKILLNPGDLQMMVQALYDCIDATTADGRHLHLQSRGILLYMDSEDSSLSATGFNNEHAVVLDTHKAMRTWQKRSSGPAIDCYGFDKVISEHMWHGHEQQDSKLTEDQAVVLNTTRTFSGYFNILYNLNNIEICSEYHEQFMPKLISVELIYICIYRMITLYQDFGRSLQALIHQTESNHYVASCALELMYRCLCVSNSISWDVINRSLLAPLNNIRQVLNRIVSTILTQISSIERRFACPYRGDNRLKRHPTMQVLGKFALPKQLKIYPVDLSLQSNLMPTRNGGMNMHSVLDLLSTRNVFEFPSPNQAPPSRGVTRSNPIFNQQAFVNSLNSPRVAHVPIIDSFGGVPVTNSMYLSSTQTVGPAYYPAYTEAAAFNSVYPSGPGGYMWNIAREQRPWQFEGGPR